MSSDVDKMYLNLSKLLKDICIFLSDDGKLEKLAPKDRKLAESLISRSKTQLQEISKITTIIINDSDEAYVDMERKSDIPEYEEEVPDKNISIYCSVDEPIKFAMDSIIENNFSSPFKDLPAKDLSRDTKYGYIQWKTKFITIFNTTKKIFAGIHDNWLLIYSNDRDSKPTHFIDLRYHEAKDISIEKNPKEKCWFQIMGTTGERKCYHFCAQTSKDMLQWVEHINRCHDNPIILSKWTELNCNIEIDDDDGTYDVTVPGIEAPDEIDEETEEEIYVDIDETLRGRDHLQLQKAKDTPPELPSRRPTALLKDATTISKKLSVSDDDSNASYDPVQSQSENEFSDDEDEEPIYHQFVQVTQPSTSQLKKNQEIKPNILPVPPKVKEKMKMHLTRNLQKLVPNVPYIKPT